VGEGVGAFHHGLQGKYRIVDIIKNFAGNVAQGDEKLIGCMNV